MKLIKPENFDAQVAKFSECLRKFGAVHSITNYENLSVVIDDSLAGLEFISPYPRTACDIGSGAGFPAIFLALVMPRTNWYLFEPNAKKASFLTYIKVNLGLANVFVHKDKIQNAPKFHADLITSRALMKSADLVKICAGFYDEKTAFLLYKGSGANDEASEFRAQFECESCEVAGHKDNRNFILVRGVKPWEK